MLNNLQEQLLKSGVLSEKEAKEKAHEVRVEATKKRKRRRGKKGNDAAPEAIEERIQEQRREKAEADRQRNREREEARKAQELRAQVRDLVQANTVPNVRGSVVYHFTHGRRVKELLVSPDLHAQLSRGELAIALWDDAYTLVPDAAATKIRDRIPEVIIWQYEPEPVDASPDEDDPYAEFPIPDDLMW